MILYKRGVFMDSNIQNQLEQTLQSDSRVWVNNDSKETSILAKNILLDLVEKTDPTIIGLLLGNDELKRHFFVEMNGVLVFKLQDFRFFLDKHSINNSYTKYANRIGLTDGNRFLKDNSDIVLDFPFKDCVLNGGQSTEEGEEIYFKRNNDQSDSQLYTKLIQKRQEIFFNQTLAFDEIDRLFDAKAFSKFSRYTADGKQAVGEIKRHSDGFLKGVPAENLIIKGNNLIALHSLATQFKGKIKLIYIDPPYYFRKNKAEDSFSYNSNFKLSTWLTFMKNRLEIAKKLLVDDGVIFVSIDDDGLAQLKLLMDDIFEKENFISYFMWMKTATPPSLSKNVRKKLEYILCYRKSTFEGLFGGIVEGGDMPLLNESNALNTLEFPAFSVQFKIPDGTYYPAKKDKTKLESELIVCNGWNNTSFKLSGNFKWTQDTITEEIKNNTTFIIKSERFAIRYIREGERNKKPSNLISKMECGVGTNEDAKKELFSLFGRDIFKYPKPESLISYLINMVTEQGDIVLDYHLGSGTTAAVAHKMNRQYIGIEQMDYIETLAVERLKKVIDGEQGGISKAVNWQGGGEFVYAELAPFNETAKQQILACESAGCLKALFEDLCEHYFLKYNVSVNEFSQIIEEPEFQSLPLDEQKQMVLEMLDLNQMYVSLSEMDDEQFAGCLNDDDKALSHAFYQSVKNQAEKKDGE